jgi:DNA methylase
MGLCLLPRINVHSRRSSNQLEKGTSLASSAIASELTQDTAPKQTVCNRAAPVHAWYRLVLGYSERLVASAIDRLGLTTGDRVLDAFCGAGTTLVECMKKGIDCVGIDANPSSIFATRVKTTWQLQGERLLMLAEAIRPFYCAHLVEQQSCESDPTFRYLRTSGMLDRGWMSEKPLLKAIAVKLAISRLSAPSRYKDALLLALIAEVVESASNVRFGPELYCGPAIDDVDVFAGFLRRVTIIATDLERMLLQPHRKARVITGDSRYCASLASRNRLGMFTAAISSPPYPAEHDYTRNSRLELAFLEHVTDLASLRSIKKRMLRCHTKGIYKNDRDAALISGNKTVEAITSELKSLVSSKTHGFARFYPTVVGEYFGGMKRHFLSLIKLLEPGAGCAYVLGDQSAYLQVHIPTADVLAPILTEVGFEVVGIEPWRTRWSTTTSREIDERIIYFRRPA